MRETLIEEAARALWKAERRAVPIDPIRDIWPDLTKEEAYAIAALNTTRRGTAVIGYKLGFTSEAMRRQMGIHEPNFGRLTAGCHAAGPFGIIDAAELIHPRVEPEIGIVVRAPVEGGDHSALSIRQHVAAVLPCLEIVDSRYTGYRFRLADSIADNSSAARFVCGHPVPLDRAGDLDAVETELSIDGDVVDRGVGVDALGGPLVALAWLANSLHAAVRGVCVAATFSGLGEVRASFI